ncbi:MAG: TolC family protein [Pirellulaceae bacterium]|nr:TolC family protein [Pirellulaceae bacterium]
MPDPASRFFDPTPTDDPLLPLPAPQLYAYRLPALPGREPSDGRRIGNPPNASQPSPDPLFATGLPGQPVQQAAFQVPAGAEEIPRPDRDSADEVPMIAGETQIVAIPESIWESVPESCLKRMFEFQSVRDEYRRTFGRDPLPAQRDDSQRLGLEDIVQLTNINSREYQRQKEVLYLAALRLTLERFDYDLKFSTGGNRHVVDYTHDRVGGETVNRLRLPTTATADQLLNTGGDLVARFANSVVLTFNGVDGFAADVGSSLLLDISQSVLQRDIIFERLTQAERNVIYAARDLARFRKEQFQRLSDQYYSLLLNYRRIEIDTQDYFSNLRGWLQSEAEYRADRRPRFEVDQFEQRSLESRSRLIGTSNSLEESLDQLKLRIGLPTELPINLDLSELEELTMRDEAAAIEERVRRARRNLAAERQSANAERTSVLLNGAIDVADKALRMLESRGRLTGQSQPLDQFEYLLDELAVEELQLEVRFNRQVLQRDRNQQDNDGLQQPPPDEPAPPLAPDPKTRIRAVPAAPPLQIFQRSTELIDSLLRLVKLQLKLVERLPDGALRSDRIEQTAAGLRGRYEQLRGDLDEAVSLRDLDKIPEFVKTAEVLLSETELLEAEVSRTLGIPPREPAEVFDWTLRRVDGLLADSQRLLDASGMGLSPVEIDMDDAMLTALTLRFSLMNEREGLADAWRTIKVAGDDLKSILNLQASQEIRTRSDVNRPFDFTFDDSQTRLVMTFDAPLNRKAQRNQFRAALINYNVALRNLMALEDETKLSVRNTLRDLQVAREQYRIAVSSAALAFERVVSTRKQLEENYGNISARDVFEAQQDYTRSLTAVAAAHISYLVDRIQLFMDLELLEVDERGFWSELYVEDFQPQPNFHLPNYGAPVYGELPPGPWFSHKMKRMLHVPPGETVIFRPDASPGEPERLPPPDDQP